MFVKMDIAAYTYACICMNNENINFYHFSIHKKKKYILVEIIYEQHCVCYTNINYLPIGGMLIFRTCVNRKYVRPSS